MTGVVTLGGRPIKGAIVHFTPTSTDAETAGAQALTDSAGTFDVHLPLERGKSEKRGLPAGVYAVTIIKLQLPTAPTARGRPTNILPAKYARAESSGLVRTVVADQVNHFEFTLEN